MLQVHLRWLLIPSSVTNRGLAGQLLTMKLNIPSRVPLGLFAAVVVTLLIVFMQLATRIFGRLRLPAIARSTLGGVVFGLVGVALRE
jgi:hypothetical protein